MENADQQVISRLTGWIEAGEMCWLCTVVKTWGSSPRPVGSLLCCNSKGEIAGSLSGGCIEEDLLEKLQQGELARDNPEVMIYGVTAEETERLGLPCGGQLDVVIEPMPDQRSLQQFQEVSSRLGERRCIERTVDIASGEMRVEQRDRFKHLQFPDEKTLIQTYGPRYQLLLIGAGQLAMCLAEMAQALDYHVVVCDPREQMLEQWSVDGAQLTGMMPDDAVKEFANDSFTAVITLTHDPRIDDMCLMEALKRDTFFVGSLGSTRTSAKRRDRLLQLDLSEEQVNSLHAPVGLPIGSKTPAEIAIAILAQLTALRSEKSDIVAADFREHNREQLVAQ
jgi:xanthine dehydrogenase accessory factor|tara:strand:- start:4142 stop:5152 length:1011 start_codon:yes stop_codon:yes gene_type:complete